MTRDEIISGLEAVVRDVRKEPAEKMLGVFITADEAEEIAKLLKEQEPKTGHWFISEYEYFTCSRCGESYYTGEESTEDARQRLADGQYYKFCPYCGAEMTGGEVVDE